MAGLTTHVLDLTSGKPAEGLNVSLFKKDSQNAKNLVGNFVTNSDGRISKPLLNEKEIKAGWYELIFFAGEYLKAFHKMPLQVTKNQRLLWGCMSLLTHTHYWPPIRMKDGAVYARLTTHAARELRRATPT